MSAKEETIIVKENSMDTDTKTTETVDTKDKELDRSEKLLKAKELYSHGSRNFLIKNYAEAADELSRVCALYEELHGELSDELGMPFLLYAKSLIALSLDENKVLDVPDEEAEDEDDEDEDNDGEDNEENDNNEKVNGDANIKPKIVNGTVEMETEDVSSESKATGTTNGNHVHKNAEADSTADEVNSAKNTEDAEVSSTHDEKVEIKTTNKTTEENNGASSSKANVLDDEKPSTSNGDATTSNGDNANSEDEDNEAATNLQLAWEILEMAAKIFHRQGLNGLPNLAEVQTELGNIQFENNILDAAREDYEKALLIYKELESNNYRRAMAEIHYKIGLSYLMQQLNKEGASSFKQACQLINDEIEEIKAKTDITEKDKNNIQDMEEIKQEIEDKIVEIDEMQAKQLAEVRAALDSYIKPTLGDSTDAGPSSSAASKDSNAAKPKANDISHLIKRKMPEEPSSEAEAAASPAKRPAL